MQSYIAGALLTLIFDWNVVQYVQRARSKTKHNDTPWLSDTPNFKLINEACALPIEHSVFSLMAELIVDTFRAILHLYHCALVWKWVNMNPTG